MAEPTAAPVVSLDLNDDTEALAEDVANKATIEAKPAAPESADVDEAGGVSTGLRPGQETAELLVEQSDPNSPLYSVKSFEELGLIPELLKGIFAMKFVKPSRIQENAIPNIIADPPKNFIGQAQSGTGKTAAYSLSMLARCKQELKEPQALCLCPTRELARQVYDVVKGLSRFTSFATFLALPGHPAIDKSGITAQIVIGTPGTVLELQKKRKLNFRSIKIFVLDEADVMIAKQGFQQQSTVVKGALPKTAQICLFSATYAEDVAAFAQKLVPNPKISIRLKPEELSLEKIQQYFIDCKNEAGKLRVLSDIFGFISVGSTIIFVHTRKTAQAVYAKMKAEGHQVSLLHGGDMEPAERDKVLDDFRSNKTRILITTNVLARGIDILQISLVINYDLPLDAGGKPEPETYLHRIGRSGRFGRAGIAINFVDDDKSKRDLKYIEKHFQKDCKPFKEEDLEQLGKMLEAIN
eukprot:TRINITY_DN8381_c0_g1_i1.p1 TRINITY_DN8381_c0_g1~~TRINITY_DN8381_c0_g1_i1.p1  ORF type:complete len:488 (-),score=161.44 TRINITY_DN8381_c0_g1_i1:43-1446(-)